LLTIGCLSQKGGVGKSTLTRLIAVNFAKAKWRVKIADFNLKQKTSTNWAAARLKAEIKPAVAAEAFNSVKPALQQRDLYDIMVFDGRPDSDTTTLEIAKIVDLVIVPVGVSLDDLDPQLAFASELRSKGIRIAKIRFAINNPHDSAVSVMEAQTLIERSGFKSFGNVLPSRISYQQAQNFGLGASETNYPTLNERANALADEIHKTLTELT